MTTRRYIAQYRHDGRAWIVQFRDPDIATFGRSLAAAKRQARSLLAVYLEVDDLAAAGVEVQDDVRLPGSVADDLHALVERRSTADTMRAEVAAATRQVAADLRRAGFSTRDVGELLGISGTRVAQMERESASARPGSEAPVASVR